CWAKSLLAHFGWQTQKANTPMAEFNKMLDSSRQHSLEVEIDKTQPCVVGAVSNHDKGKIVFSKKIDSPILSVDVHQNQPVYLIAPIEIQQRLPGSLYGDKLEQIILFCRRRGSTDNEVHFERVVRQIARILERKQ